MRIRGKKLAGFVAGALLLAGIGIANASIPDTNGVIHACIQPSNGNLTKIIDTDQGQSCSGGEQALNWNQTGPQGPAGATGATGPQGPAGTVGPLTYVSHTFGVQGGSTTQAQAVCPEGTVVTGGGFSGQNDYLVARSSPILNGGTATNTGWEVILHDLSGTDNNTAGVYAICAPVPAS